MGTRLVVRLVGALTNASAPAARVAMLKCLADQPEAVIVDISALVVTQPPALTVFAAVARHAAVWPGIPIVLCAPAPAVAELLSNGGYGRLAVYPSMEQAITADPHRQISSLVETLLPLPGAARRARRLTAEACTRWQVPHLVERAVLIADALVGRALARDQSMVDLRMVLRRRYLLIAARHSSHETLETTPDEPILFIAQIASRWGTLSTETGDVTWATLDIRNSRRH